MSRAFLDTNIFIRYLTNDDPQKADRVDDLLDRAARGEITLVTADIILAEIVWVLESFYKLRPPDIAEKIKAILCTPGLSVLSRADMNHVLRTYLEYNVDFIDALMTGIMEKSGIDKVYSFDRKHLNRITEIKRLEP